MKVFLLLLTLLLSGGPSRADELVFAVSTGSAMPMTAFQAGTLTGGLLKDFGDALARELRMNARYLPVPRKRVETPLQNGQADILCDLRPEWLEGQEWRWSEAIFSNHQIIVTRTDTPAISRISDIDALRIGTILGYQYAQVEAALGRPLAEHFLRDDASSDDANLAKLLHQRFAYMLTNSLYYDYQRKIHPERLRLAAQVYRVMSFDTYCALPPRGKLDLPTLNKAIQSMKKRGEIQLMIDRFRPPAAGG